MTIQKPLPFFIAIHEKLTDKPIQEEQRNVYKLMTYVSDLLFGMDEEEAMARIAQLNREQVRYVERCYNPNISNLLRVMFFKVAKLGDRCGDTSIKRLSSDTELKTSDILTIMNSLIWHGLIVPSLPLSLKHSKGQESIFDFLNTRAKYSAKFRLTAMGLRYYNKLEAEGFEDVEVNEAVLMGEHHFIEDRKIEAITYLTQAIKYRRGLFVYDIVSSDSLLALPQLKGFKKGKIGILLTPLNTLRLDVSANAVKSPKRLYAIRNQELYAKHPIPHLKRLYSFFDEKRVEMSMYDDRKKAEIVDSLALFFLGYNKRMIAGRLNIEKSIVSKHIKKFMPEGRETWLEKQ